MLKVLLGGDPDPVRNSTGVCDRHLVQCTIAVSNAGSKSTWMKFGLEDEIAQLKLKIEERLKAEDEIAPQLSEQNNAQNFRLQIEDQFFFDTQPDNIDSRSPSCSDDLNQDINEQQDLEPEDQSEGFSTHAVEDLLPISEDIRKHTGALIACYDSGGQPEFFDVMPAITTSLTGYVMVFDMSKDLHGLIAEEFYKASDKCIVHHSHSTSAEVMKTALANIQSSSGYVSDHNCPVKFVSFSQLLVVGTHLDKCGDTEDDQDGKVLQVDQALECDVLTLPGNSKVHVVHRLHRNTKLVHPISNVVKEGRDEAAQEIRTAIENLSESDEQIPLSWLLFQYEVRFDAQVNGKSYIARNRCAEIAKGCCIEETDVDSILTYFHELGILLHYKNIPGFQHVVFCDPQWLFDKLTKLIEVKYNPPRALRQNILKGVFDQKSLHEMYKTDFSSSDILCFEHLVHLFVSLNIMAILPGTTDEYFMPALLDPAPADIDTSDYGSKIYDTLIVKFENKYIPQGVFCNLVVECMRKAIGWSFVCNKTVYKNLIIFQISTDIDLYVFLRNKIDYVTVELYHQNNTAPLTSPDVICNTLYSSLKNVCKKLRINDDFTFGFLCTLCQGFAGVRLQYPFQAQCVCEKCSNRYLLKGEQTVWLISASSIMEVNIRNRIIMHLAFCI